MNDRTESRTGIGISAKATTLQLATPPSSEVRTCLSEKNGNRIRVRVLVMDKGCAEARGNRQNGRPCVVWTAAAFLLESMLAMRLFLRVPLPPFLPFFEG